VVRKASDSPLAVIRGDCIEVLGELESESVDAVITDPPYAIGINGERWDGRAIDALARARGDRISRAKAYEAWCHLWARECLRVVKPGAHLLAFGSPRTVHRLAAAIEDAGFEIRDMLCWLFGTGMATGRRLPDGRRTKLRSAFEPILLARRPLDGTAERNVERHGTGALEVESCRTRGRYPANVLLGDEAECAAGGCVCEALDVQARRGRRPGTMPASHFFYCPKANRRERDAGCEHLPSRHLDLFPNASRKTRRRTVRNSHPTVKPIELMRWLVRLGSPPGGLVLDPCCGSGTTGAAAAIEGRRFLGIEQSTVFSEIASARIGHWAPSEGKVLKVDFRPDRRKAVT
jgi:DNA modification methylase